MLIYLTSSGGGAEIAPHVRPEVVVATKSTVPVGMSREIERRLRAFRLDADLTVCAIQEFVREGSAIRDFTHPDRVLIGCDSTRGRKVMQRLYKPLAIRNAPIDFISRESAELAKYAANAAHGDLQLCGIEHSSPLRIDGDRTNRVLLM